MKSRYAIFDCNVCGKGGVGHNIAIAENDEEYKRLCSSFRPPFAETEDDKLLKQFDCFDENCKGKINIILGEKLAD